MPLYYSSKEPSVLNLPKKRLINVTSEHANLMVPNQQSLIIKGQGVSAIVLKEPASLAWEIYSKDKTQGLKLEVLDTGAVLYQLYVHDDFGKKQKDWKKIAYTDKTVAALDLDLNCVYWFSIDGPNQRVSYGKGEMRQATVCLNYPPQSSKSTETSTTGLEWLKEVCVVTLDSSAALPICHIWREPVTLDPALIVLGTDCITMMDVANNSATVPENLTSACQIIHANITGTRFQLDTPDFPDFSKAIEASIADEQGWCHKTLKEKECEFGKCDEQSTYLRITLGVNQGDSPGIPNVLEIWPPGHYSPIHNHGDANAIIRVLHGEIEVQLYPMLSVEHIEPFATKRFVKDQVTWLSPGLNQIHKLKNPHEHGPTCITIQSYLYGEANDTHYEYFDYIDGDKIKQFTPNSDMGFIQFKAKMKEEWYKKN
ncbi:MAG: putative metal-dependent enzyme (double-stranded beta helix superfamily) [Paraglaciecola sp.]|jgi:predicted metal-dependent enzyme (double-stranded beta helix superfamily)